MFERFTERARQVVVLAQEEARTLKHNYIGTEHILLGLVRENEGVAARILLDFDADSEQIRNEVIRMLSGPGGRQRSGGGGGGAAATAPEPAPWRRPPGPDSIRMTSLRIFSESASKSSRMRAATPSFSRTKPSRMCSVPM